jgi:putative transport protein
MVAKWVPERGIGFPIGYAVSGILLTVFGYFAMILAQ